MKQFIWAVCASFCFLVAPPEAKAMFKDDPWLTKLMSELEYLEEEGEGILEWDIDLWSGKDLNKYWIKSEGELHGSEINHANIEFVRSHAITAYWDQQFGLRHDLSGDGSNTSRNWVSYGFIGTAPYFISVDARVLVGEESSSQMLVELEREFMLTQEWVLTPELDIILNGRTNERFAEGAGVAEIELSVRLGYEHKGNRKFQPFIGITASQLFGTTRSLQNEGGRSASSVEGMIGIHFWF